LQRNIQRPIAIAVDEWNVWYRTHGATPTGPDNLEEKYNLEDALVVAMHFNAFIRHARSVKMANIAQLVNVIAPIFTNPDGLFLQTIFYPIEIYRQSCGNIALDVFWTGDTFSTAEHAGLRVLDVSATLDDRARKLTVFVVNRSQTDEMETTITLDGGQFAGTGQAWGVNGADNKAENSFDAPDRVSATRSAVTAGLTSATYTFEPHSVTALSFDL